MDSMGCRGIAGKARKKAISAGEDLPMPVKDGAFRTVKGEWTIPSYGVPPAVWIFITFKRLSGSFPKSCLQPHQIHPRAAPEIWELLSAPAFTFWEKRHLALDIGINLRLQKCPE